MALILIATMQDHYQDPDEMVPAKGPERCLVYRLAACGAQRMFDITINISK